MRRGEDVNQREGGKEGGERRQNKKQILINDEGMAKQSSLEQDTHTRTYAERERERERERVRERERIQ